MRKQILFIRASKGVDMKTWIVMVMAVIMMTVPGGYVMAEDVDSHISIQENSQADDIPVVIDVLVLRPVGLATCVIGMVASVVALPFAIPSHSTGKMYRALIVEPFNYTFKRPLGKNRVMDEEAVQPPQSVE